MRRHEEVRNGIEYMHRFTRAVSVGSPQEFLPVEKDDQERAEAGKRLIKNGIICWNYLSLGACPRKNKQACEICGTMKIKAAIMFHGERLSLLPAGSRFTASTELA